MARVASTVSGSRSRRVSRSSFHSAVMASGRFRARTQRHHEAGATTVGELMNDMGGQSVEKVRIVDADQDPALTMLSDKGIDHMPHVGHGIGDRIADQCREGAERKRFRGFGADDPVRAFTRAFRARQHFACEPGLPDARRPHDHYPGTLAAPAERATNR